MRTLAGLRPRLVRFGMFEAMVGILDLPDHVAPKLLGAAFAAALGAGAPAAASTPAPAWLGVERILITCHFDASVRGEALRSSVCRQVVREAARLTAYPVSLATGAELDARSGRLTEQAKQLVLHVEARLPPEDASSILISVRPERIGSRAWRGHATQPVAVPVRRSGDEVEFQGPVMPLSLILAEPGTDRRLPPLPRSRS